MRTRRCLSKGCWTSSSFKNFRQRQSYKYKWWFWKWYFSLWKRPQILQNVLQFFKNHFSNAVFVVLLMWCTILLYLWFMFQCWKLLMKTLCKFSIKSEYFSGNSVSGTFQYDKKNVNSCPLGKFGRYGSFLICIILVKINEQLLPFRTTYS